MPVDPEIFAANRRSTERIRAIGDRLTDDELGLPVGEHWTVAITLAHLAFWDRRALDSLRRSATANRPVAVDVDIVVNDLSLPLWAAIPPREAVRLALDAATEIDAFVATLDEPLVDALLAAYPRWVRRSLHRTEHLDEAEATLRPPADTTTPIRITTLDGRILTGEDSGLVDPRLTIVFHNGSPHTGRLLAPVVEAAHARRIRVVTYARPSYGGSTPRPGRRVADAAGDVAAVADALGIDRFAVVGYSGGGPHALACAALLPDRVLAAVSVEGPAPDAPDLDWLAGMQAPGALRAAREGRPARARFAETDAFDLAQFTDADFAALSGEWAAVGGDAVAAEGSGPDGLIDDDVAFAMPWGIDPGAIRVPVLIVQGTADRVVPPPHGAWLASHIPGATLWRREGDGHVSSLRALPTALDWLLEHAPSD